MNEFLWVFVAHVAAFFLGMLLAPVVIKAAARLKAGQSVLVYVHQHETKEGTPTFGGLIFIIAATAVAAAFNVFAHELGRMLMLVFLGYGLIGFTDDFIKIKLKRNKGLTAWQKIIFQLAAGFIAAWFSYKSEFIGSAVSLNFGLGEVDMGVWYLPFATIVFVAMSNAVNLTDGLDGLAGGTGTVYASFFAVIVASMYLAAKDLGYTAYAEELGSVLYAAAALIGALLAFLMFNAPKAAVFMGDTGSLALGAFFAAIALFTKNPFIGALIGITYVVSCISVIIQVASFKLRKKRVFLMSPLHHHLELKGVSESKISAAYAIVTAIAGLTALAVI